MERVGVIGGGAMGSLMSSMISRSMMGQNNRVVVLVTKWKEHVRSIEANGGRIRLRRRGEDEIVSCPVRCASYDDEDIPLDIAFVTTKASGTRDAADLLSRCLSPDGVVVTLQNGFGNANVLSESVGMRRVVRGVTSRGATMVGPGCVRDAGGGPTVLCRLDDGNNDDQGYVERVASLLSNASFECTIAENDSAFDEVAWTKLCANAVINPLTAILRVRNGEILDPQTWTERAPLVRSVLAEIRTVARESSAVDLPSETVLEDLVRDVARKTATNRSSMLQDMDRGVVTEIDSINGFVVAEGRRLGVPTPANESVCEMIRGRLGAS
eukprot:g1970.t1